MTDRRLFVISDPHLSFAANKPMHVFGSAWVDHPQLLGDNWRASVRENDVVLVPGDISWALRLDAAKPDLEWLANLPGIKVLLKGNHDYWWQSLGKLKALGLPHMHYIQNNHVVIDDIAIGGARLWDFPYIRWPFEGTASGWSVAAAQEKGEPDPEKIRARELARLSHSLAGLPREAKTRVAMTHFPPLGEDGLPTPLTGIIGSHNIDICVFGHVHAMATHPRPGEDIRIGKTRYVLASTDILRHTPKLIELTS